MTHDKHGVLLQYTQDNPEYRKSFNETKEKYRGMHPRKLAAIRRFAIQKSRFQDRSPETIGEAAACRQLMETEING